MEQPIDAIEVTDEEATTISAHVRRLQEAGEKGLTAEALLARMTLKIVRGWNDQAVAERRQLMADSVIDAMRTATPEKVQEALRVLSDEAAPEAIDAR